MPASDVVWREEFALALVCVKESSAQCVVMMLFRDMGDQNSFLETLSMKYCPSKLCTPGIDL